MRTVGRAVSYVRCTQSTLPSRRLTRACRTFLAKLRTGVRVDGPSDADSLTEAEARLERLYERRDPVLARIAAHRNGRGASTTDPPYPAEFRPTKWLPRAGNQLNH